MAGSRKVGPASVSNGRLHDPKPPADLPPNGEPDMTARDRARASGYEPPLGEPTRRPAGERENAFNALAWLLEGATGLLEEVRHNDLGLSEEFWVHASAARREGLLAARALIDTLIEKTDAAEVALADKQKRRERRGGIEIEF